MARDGSLFLMELPKGSVFSLLRGLFKKTSLKFFSLYLVFILGTGIIAAQKQDYQGKTKILLRDTWNLSALYSGLKEWEADFKLLENNYLQKMTTFKRKLNSASQIAVCLEFVEKMCRRMDKVFVYIHLKADLNQNDAHLQYLKERAVSLNQKVVAAMAFINPEILAKPKTVLDNYLRSKSLVKYQPYLQKIRQERAHILDEKQEELLAEFAEITTGSRDIYEKARLFDLQTPLLPNNDNLPVLLNNQRYLAALESKERSIRQKAFEAVYHPIAAMQHTFAATLTAEIKKNVFLARVRRYANTLEAALQSEGIPQSLYQNLRKSVSENLHLLSRSIQLRRKVLGLDKVQLYDMQVSLLPDFRRVPTFAEAKTLLREGLKPLGTVYREVMEEAFSSRWLDVYASADKVTGSYQWGAYDSHPYILLNYHQRWSDVLTLAHELGHGINDYYTKHNQSYFFSNLPVLHGEIAAITNELLLINHLITKAQTKQERAFFINVLVEFIQKTFFTQAMYAEFELIITQRSEKKRELSPAIYNGICKKLMAKYYGPSFAVDQLSLLWWSRLPHFYKGFYVAKYPMALAIANHIVDNLTSHSSSHRQAYQSKYLEFLKLGSSQDTAEALKKLNIELNSPQIYDHLLSKFHRLIKELEFLLEAEIVNQ